jgi:GT2 family glycosyltransferase
MEEKVAAVIPVFNRIADTLQCVESLYRQKWDGLKVVVVDDGSTDGTERILKERYPDTIVLKGDGNLWWSGAVAVGVDYCLNELRDLSYVLILNNDLVFESDLVARLVAKGRIHSRSIISGISVDSSDRETVVRSGSNVRSWMLNLSSHPFLGSKLSLVASGSDQKVDMLNGRCLLIRPEVFREVGNFSFKDFPQYGGDNEFTLRAKRKGWDLLLVPSIPVYLKTAHTGLNPVARSLTFAEVAESLRSIRSVNNLTIRTRFALKCAPWYAVPSFLLMTYLKIAVHSFGALVKR